MIETFWNVINAVRFIYFIIWPSENYDNFHCYLFKLN